MENLNNAYYFLKKSNVNSLDEAISYINGLLNYVELYSQKYVNYNGLLYKNELLSFKSESCIDIVDVQSRILDGFKYDINLLTKNVSTNNESSSGYLFIFEISIVGIFCCKTKFIFLPSVAHIFTFNFSKIKCASSTNSL